MAEGGSKKSFFNDVRFQLGYGIFLMVLIPAVIIFNTIFIINRYNENVDTSLQRQGLIIARVFGAAAGGTILDVNALQRIVTEVQRANPDILSLHVLVPEGEDFKVLTSSRETIIGATLGFRYYDIAWKLPRQQALATDAINLDSNDPTLDWQLYDLGKRFWLISMPLFDEQNQKIALLSIQMSSEVVDDLTDRSWRASVISVSLTILMSILFLGASTRLWGYATLYRKMKEVDEMKDEFISIASHELRTPITAIRGYASMVIDGSFGVISKKAKIGMARVMESSKRLGDLVEDLLNVSRIEQGRIQFDNKPVRPYNLIHETVEELLPQAQAKKLKLVLESPKNLPPVLADKDKLKQILINILGNSLKYTKKGSVTLTAHAADSTLVIKVKDTGVGISAEAQKGLFQKFYRVRSEKTKDIAGTGLGLWITKQLVEAMKGKVAVESIEGTGTQVTLIFPVIKKS